MGLKVLVSKIFAAWVNRDINNIRKNALALQQKTFHQLIQQANQTVFGKDHHFKNIHSYDDFQKKRPYS